MFKNRSIQMSLVKTAKSPQTEAASPTVPVDHYAEIALESARIIVKDVAIAVGTYMAVDALRKIAIHIVVTKIN